LFNPGGEALFAQFFQNDSAEAATNCSRWVF
jgi:hypothetical protein